VSGCSPRWARGEWRRTSLGTLVLFGLVYLDGHRAVLYRSRPCHARSEQNQPLARMAVGSAGHRAPAGPSLPQVPPIKDALCYIRIFATH